MSQNTPQDPRETPPGGENPYYRQAAPDLDANTPVLKAEDAQKLNRKALFFLGGTLALVIFMIAVFLTSGGGDEDASSATERPEPEQVRVPELPQSVQQAPTAPLPTDVPPIPLEEPIAEEIPPLPGSPGMGGYPAQPPPPPAPSLVDRRIADAGGLSGGSGVDGTVAALEQQQNAAIQQVLAASEASGAGQPGSGATAAGRPTAASSPTFLENVDVRMVRGTYLRCVMETRIITDLPGYSSCVITEPVYSVNGQRLLLPKGSKVYGMYGDDFKNNRVAVVWDRVLTPQGVDITLSAPGVDNLGSSGVPGQYDAHWGRRISGALMISLVGDAFSYAAAEYGPQTTTIGAGGFATQDPFESQTAETMQQLAEEFIEENSKRPPTVTVNQGTVINIYVTKDIDFSSVLPPS